MEDDTGTENKGSMWVLDQKLDQPMDEEAERLRNMYREKVLWNSISVSSYPSIHKQSLRIIYAVIVACDI